MPDTAEEAATITNLDEYRKQHPKKIASLAGQAINQEVTAEDSTGKDEKPHPLAELFPQENFHKNNLVQFKKVESDQPTQPAKEDLEPEEEDSGLIEDYRIQVRAKPGNAAAIRFKNLKEKMLHDKPEAQEVDKAA